MRTLCSLSLCIICSVSKSQMIMSAYVRISGQINLNFRAGKTRHHDFVTGKEESIGWRYLPGIPCGSFVPMRCTFLSLQP